MNTKCGESPCPGASTNGSHSNKACKTKIDISSLKSEVVAPKDEDEGELLQR